MNRKIIIGAIIAFVVLLVLMIFFFAFGSNKDKKKAPKVTSGDITLTYWRLFDDKETFEPIINEYQKEHPNIKIEYKKLTYAEYEKNLLEALAGGRGPDMFSIGNSWIPKYMDKISPMPEDLLSAEEYGKSFFKVATLDNVVSNRIYGMPLAIDSLALYVNNDIVARTEINETPDTWEEIVGKPGDPNVTGVLTKLNNRQGDTFNLSAVALGNTTANRAQDILALLMLQQRTDMVNDNRDQALFNLTKKVEGRDIHLGTEALKFYTSFADPRSPNYSWNAGMGDSVKAFAQGKVAYMLAYGYTARDVERLNPALNFSISPAPQIGGQDPVNYASYWTEVVSKGSQHQAEAWDFINFAAGRNQVGQYLEAAKKISARPDLSTSGKFNAIYEGNASAISWYKGEYLKADPIFIDMINQVLAGEDPQRAIDNAANRQTNALKELKSASQ